MNAQVELGPKGLTLPLSAGPVYFNYYWLRDNCATSTDTQTRERIFDISELPGEPVAEKAATQNGELVIDWRGEDHRTSYSLAWLDDFARLGHIADPADLPRRLWRSNQYPSFVRLDQALVENDPGTRARFARAIIEDGVALITGMENSDGSLTRLAQTLGEVIPTTDGFYFDVQLEIAPTNLAFTARALEMHTDLPWETLAPGVQFLHCRANTVEGGNSLFLDGAAVAEDFRNSNPADFELLATHDIPFFRRHERWDARAHQRVIELDRHGAVSGLTISQHLADVFDLPQPLLDDYYPAFCRFVHALKKPEYMNRFRLNAGECIVFDNHRVVHGREAFSAETGQRHLRGCYVDVGALRSTYRVLAREGHLGMVPEAAE